MVISLIGFKVPCAVIHWVITGFANRVVAAMAHRTHRRDQIVDLQEALLIKTPELQSAIWMHHDRCFTLALPNSNLDGADNHLSVLPMVHRPADY